MNRSAAGPSIQSPSQQPIGPATAALTLLLSALWGGTPVAIKYSVGTLEPIAVAGIRFAMATLFMLLWCRLEGTSLRLRPGQLWPSLVLGVLLFLQIALFTLGIDWSNASHGTLFVNTFVFWVVALEHFVTRTDRLSPLRLVGLAIAAGGVLSILAVTDGPGPNLSAAGSIPSGSATDQPSLAGDLILLASAFLLGVKIIYTKHAMRTVEPGKLIFWHDVVGVVLFAVCSLIFEETTFDKFTTPAVLGLLYQGVVVAGFCFAMQARLLQHHSASQLSVFAFATPLFGIALAVLFRGDPFSPWLGLSALCVAAGICLVNRTPPVAQKRRFEATR